MEEQTHAGMGKTYMKIWGVLAFFTAVEFGVTYTALAEATQVAIIVVLSIIKAILVVMYFMHVKYESKPFKYLGIIPLFLTAFLVLFLIF